MLFDGKASNAAVRTLLKQRYWPHYVNERTKPSVLLLYRHTLKESQKFMDPLCREYLRAYIYESFSASKYQTNEHKIQALINIAQQYLYTLQRSNTNACLVSINSVMHFVFSQYKTTELPLNTLINQHHNHKQHQHRVDHSDITFKLKHLQPPGNVSSFQEHFDAEKRKDHLFYRFVTMLKRNKAIFGYRGRKLYLNLATEDTVTGTPLPLSRQKNLVAKYYRKILKDVVRPVHPDVLEYLLKQAQTPEGVRNASSRRFYTRRLENCLKTYYTVVQTDGELHMQSSNDIRRKLSSDIYRPSPQTSVEGSSR